MKIIVITAYMDLHEEFRKEHHLTIEMSQDPSIVSQFSPSLFFETESFDVLKDHDDFYIRVGEYEGNIHTYKTFDQDREYEPDEEILHTPSVIECSPRTITGIIPTTEERIEESRELLVQTMIDKMELEHLRSQIMLTSLKDKNKRKEHI